VKPFALRAPEPVSFTASAADHECGLHQAFNEVKEVGRFESASRTADQTHLALWWKDFVENSHNRLARQIVAQENTDLWVAARMFALLNMSVMDAYISVFENKFFYTTGAPTTAIRWAANDGNPIPFPIRTGTTLIATPIRSRPIRRLTAQRARQQ